MNIDSTLYSGHPGINTSTVHLLREDVLRCVREAKVAGNIIHSDPDKERRKSRDKNVPM